MSAREDTLVLDLLDALEHALGRIHDFTGDCDVDGKPNGRSLLLEYDPDLAFALERNLIRARALLINKNSGNRPFHDHSPGLADELMRGFAATLGRVIALMDDAALDHDRVLDLSHAQVVAVELSRAIRDLALANLEQREAATSPNRVASRLTAAATHLLPVAHRARYREEFARELNELADRPSRTHWYYALNVLLNAWSLRRSLRRAELAPARER